MSKFLIEVPHGSEKFECQRSIEILLTTGSHFLTNAEWGCLDGEHKAWFIMDADNKVEVLRILPPAYRKDAKITQLTRFKLKDVEDLLGQHLM